MGFFPIADGTVPRAINTDFSIALELRQPVPFQGAQLFEIGQSTVPTIKGDQFRLKTVFSRLLHHISEMIIFGQAILRLVVNAKITRQPTGIASPHQRDQVDTFHNPTMLGVS